MALGTLGVRLAGPSSKIYYKEEALMINMLDLKQEFIEIEDEVIEKVVSILKSSRYVLGPNVDEFEGHLASYHEVPFAVGVSSGTSALHLSLASLGIDNDDEVITTPFTFFASIESIIYRNAVPIFVDIEEDTLNINIDLIEEKITKKTKAIMPVHLFGLPCNMKAIMDIADRHGLMVIEDCAQSFGSTLWGQKTGTFGHAGCFSFYPSKNLGCYGDGGALITNDEDVANEVKALRNHGASKNYTHKTIGFNSRLDEIQAGILLIKLTKVDRKNELRRENAKLYNELLKGIVTVPVEPDGYISNYHQYTIRTPKRETLRKALQEESIASVVYYPIPMHLQNALSNYGYKEGDFPVSEAASKQVLSLPVYPGMEAEKIERVCEVIKRCIEKNG